MASTHVLTADHQRDRLPHVVDNDRETVRPVSIAVANREITCGGRLSDLWPEAPVVPRFGVPGRTQFHPQGPFVALRQVPVAASARTTRPPPRHSTLGRPRCERRSGAGTGVDEAGGSKPFQRNVVRCRGLALADRPRVGHEPQPFEVLDASRRRTPVGSARDRGPRFARARASLSRPPGPRPQMAFAT